MKYARGSATVAAATVRSRGRPTALPAPDRDHRASRRQAGVAVDRDGDVDNRANARATTNIGAAVAHNALDGRFAPVHTAHSSTTGVSAFGLSGSQTGTIPPGLAPSPTASMSVP